MNLVISIDELLRNLDNEFIPSLSSVIDISSYTQKIFSNAKIISCHDAGKLTAFIAFYCNDPKTETGYMSMLAIASENRRTGLASNLIKISIEILRNSGFKNYNLEVYKTNINAINLYKKLNFTVISELSHSYIMNLKLNN